MSSIIRLSNLFKSVASSEYPYQFEQFTKTSGNRNYTHIKPQNVDDTEFYTFTQFLSTIEIAPDEVDNLGSASYQNDVFQYHSPVYFGLRNGELGLLIGSTRFENATDIFVKCEVEEVEKQHGKKKLKVWEYTLNGTPIELYEPVDNEGKPTGKFYISIDFHDELDDIKFIFPFAIDKKGNFTPEDIRKAWKTGKFSDVCRDLDAVSSRIWIEANKAFIPSFESNQFPKGGVLILAKNGDIKVTPAGTSEKIKSDIVQSNWTIVATSHPELVVQFKNKEKQFEFTCLGDATDIQFTSAQFNNEGFTWLERNTCFSEQMVLIHIVEPSRLKITNTPVNTVTAYEQRVLAKIVRFPHLLEIYHSRTVKVSPANNVSFDVPEKSSTEDINGFDNHGAKSLVGAGYNVPSAPDDF
jgi:hypothetical protein